MDKPTTVEEYLAALPDERRAAVEELRRTIGAAAPEATEIRTREEDRQGSGRRD